MQRGHLFDLESEATDDDPLARRRRSQILLTAVALLLGVLMLGFGALLLISELAPRLAYALIAVSFIRFFGIPLGLRGHTTVAFISNMIAGLVLYAAFTLEFGPNAGIDIWAPSLVGLPMLIAERQDRSVRLAAAAAALATVFGAAAVARGLPSHTVLSPATLLTIRRVNLAGAVLFTTAILLVYRRLLDRAELSLEAAQRTSERLLGNILPGRIATRLKRDEYQIADQFH
ncbi:MAG: hypothetical protein ACREFQ_22205, partial [Stellaceae bacterium]